MKNGISDDCAERVPAPQASVYEKTAEGFRLLERCGGLSEIGAMALALRL
jgi:hypothetical protein